MSQTRIITTIGPSSLNDEVLSYFSQNGVEIARLNFSHNTSEWHIQAAKECRKHGLQVLMDLSGPKVRLGELTRDVILKEGKEVLLEYAKPDVEYPFYSAELLVVGTGVDLVPSLTVGQGILIDDGKIMLEVVALYENEVLCKTVVPGIAKSRKGVNMPGVSAKVDFLTTRDRKMLADSLLEIRPEYVACSFVTSAQDVQIIIDEIKRILDTAGVTDYFPKICPKIEQSEAVQKEALQEIIDLSDIIMIARGDLALETMPVHVAVPFYQEKIKRMCNASDTPYIVATQILESMIDSPVPTRAEISDLYRAVVLDRANYVMLSGEAAVGDFPKQCVQLMNTMIEEHEQLEMGISD